MATQGPTSLTFSNSSAVNFRAWAKHISDTLTTAGWVNTADTGQIDLATVAAPGATNTKMGYQIWRMNDALQSTKPVFIRIDYGSGASVLGDPGIWLTIGTGSNGSGTITGIIFNGTSTTIATTQGTSDATARNCVGSGSTNRVSVWLAQSSASNHSGFGIERTKDSSGADSDVGLLILIGTTSSSAFSFPAGWSTSITFTNTHDYIYMYMPFVGTQPPTAPGLTYALFNGNPSVFGSDVGFGVPIPMATIARQPGTNFAVCRTSDVLADASVAVTVYGGSVTYYRLNTVAPQIAVNNTVTLDSTAALMMRFD